ncbi:MAG: response regulator transcription factor [Chloroflexi bacterium]|nr:response regulator transcription factor [Chloroflexota bacterium]
MNVIRVLLHIPSPALRAGVRALLLSDKAIRVVNDSLDEESNAEVVIASVGEGGEGGKESVGILFLGEEPVNVEEMRRAGRAWGVLPAEASAEELIAAVHAIAQGLVVGTPVLLFPSESGTVERGLLTERETEVLELLAKGLANKQIAAALGISEHTVKFHVSSLYAKLNVTNRAEAVREGLRGGWIAL